jgi:tubulin-specific chaperone D
VRIASVLQMRALLSVLNSSVQHVDTAVRSAAGSCLTHFLKGYACEELMDCSTAYCHLLEDGTTNRRIGGAVALGALPCALAAPCMGSIVPKLRSAIQASTAKDCGDVDARVAAIQV